MLTADDRAAIAAYLKSVPARPNGYGKTDIANYTKGTGS
jgi:hypothetical protein